MSEAQVLRTGGQCSVWRSLWLVAAGSGALTLGLTVYLVDRNGLPAVLLPALHGGYGGHGSLLFGRAGQWLPSFFHPLALSLFTVAVWPARVPPQQLICAAWCAINVLCEAGQHVALKATAAAAVYTLLGQRATAQTVARYFERGTFDVGDIAAALLGGLAAAACLRLGAGVGEQTNEG